MGHGDDTHENIFAILAAIITGIVTILQILAFTKQWRKNQRQRAKDSHARFGDSISERIKMHWFDLRKAYTRDSLINVGLLLNIDICNFYLCILAIQMWYGLPSCNVCSYGYTLTTVFYTIGRVSNYLFFLNRARASQGISQVMMECCFTRFCPIGLVVLGLLYIISFILFFGSSGYCDADPHLMPRCHNITDDEDAGAISSGALIESFFSLFFLFIFSWPLYKVIRNSSEEDFSAQVKARKAKARKSSLMMVASCCAKSEKDGDEDHHSEVEPNSMSGPQSSGVSATPELDMSGSPRATKLTTQTSDSRVPRQTHLSTQVSNSSMRSPHSHSRNADTRAKFLRVLYVNVTLTFLNLLTSNLLMILWPIDSVKYYMLPFIDYSTNAVTTFLMPGRNRNYLYRLGRKLKRRLGRPPSENVPLQKVLSADVGLGVTGGNNGGNTLKTPDTTADFGSHSHEESGHAHTLQSMDTTTEMPVSSMDSHSHEPHMIEMPPA